MRLAAVVSVAALLGAATLARAQAEAYSSLVARYAKGDRAAAVAELAGLDEAELARQLEALQQRATAAARCPSCPHDSAPPLRAAVMLHTDRDELERRPLRTSGERELTCGPPVQAALAERAVWLLLGDALGRDFALRWYQAMALRSLGDLCLDEARDWVAAGIKHFPKQKELLLVRGAIAEETVAAALVLERPPLATSSAEWDRQHELKTEQHTLLNEGRAALEQALAVDPGFEEAALRLGHIRYRLGQAGPALQTLAGVIDHSRDPARLYLAHLFSARIQEAAGRVAEAEREYRAALALDADGQAAAMGLSHLQLLAGGGEASRDVLDAALARAGVRRHADPFWDYPLGLAKEAEPLFAALRSEASAP